MKGVGLAFYAGMFNHAAGIGLETGHGATDVAIDLDDLFDRGGFEEGGGDSFFDTEDYACGCSDLHSSQQ